jgi:hypothetical protein
MLPSQEKTDTSSLHSALRRKSYVVAAVLLIFVLFSLIYGRLIIHSDGVTYYALTRSLIEDHDFDLANQSLQFTNLHTSPRPGKISSLYSCGFSLLYFPFVWTARQIGSLLPSVNIWKPYIQNEMIPIQDSIGIFLGSIVLALASIFIISKLLRDRFGASFEGSLFVAMAMFLGTPFAFHTFSAPSFPHAADIFLVTAAVYFAMNRGEEVKNGLRWKNICLGFFLAFAILLRNNNIVLVLPLVGGVLFFERKNGWKKFAISCLEILTGAFPALLVQALYNWNQYGEILTTGYRVDFSNEPISEKWLALSRFYNILIDPSAGLFFWAPVTVLSFLGLITGAFKKRKETLIALLSIIVVIISLRFMRYLWSGASFGQRFILHLFPFYVIGLYEVFALSRKITTVMAVICTLWTFFLMNLYLMVFPSPELREKIKIKKDVEVTPFRLMDYAQSVLGRQRVAEKGTIGVLWDSLGGQPYPTLIHVLQDGKNSEELLSENRKGKRRNKPELD